MDARPSDTVASLCISSEIATPKTRKSYRGMISSCLEWLEAELSFHIEQEADGLHGVLLSATSLFEKSDPRLVYIYPRLTISPRCRIMR